MRRMKSIVMTPSVTVAGNCRTIALSIPPACDQTSKFDSTVVLSSLTSKVRGVGSGLVQLGEVQPHRVVAVGTGTANPKAALTGGRGAGPLRLEDRVVRARRQTGDGVGLAVGVAAADPAAARGGAVQADQVVPLTVCAGPPVLMRTGCWTGTGRVAETTLDGVGDVVGGVDRDDAVERLGVGRCGGVDVGRRRRPGWW